MSVRRGTLAAALLATGLMLTGCASSLGKTAPAAAGPVRQSAANVGRSAPRTVPVVAARIPGLGPKMRSEISAKTSQAVVVTGDGPNSNRSEVVVYQREAKTGWQPVSAAWPAHNALRGWTHHHLVNDLRSPDGVFGLTDAGGSLADPGSQLPYHQSTGFDVGGTGFEGESLAGSFDYVVAINYNRDPGTSPLNGGQPLGPSRGGGIWLHVDHGGPTHGCVSLPKARMKQLLGWLDPSKHPVVVMGDAASLKA